MQQGKQVWRYLIIIFAIFWLIFACVLILSDFPFLVISMALTTVAVLSAIVVVLSWAYQNNW
jgi:hypothetical protein